MKVITLFGGSTTHAETVFTRAAREFGRRIARAGWVLRTGAGSGASVMGRAADGALAEGGTVEGVILAKFWSVRHRSLHSLRAAHTFSERKAGLLDGAAAAVVFPGGIGTLDEFGDVLDLKLNGFLSIPLVLVNIDGYFDRLIDWLRRDARRHRFVGRAALGLFRVARTPAAAVRILRATLGKKTGLPFPGAHR